MAALRTATEAAQAEAARSHVKLHDDAIRAIHETGETHAAGLAAVERTTAAFAAAADQQLPSETIVETWNANESDPEFPSYLVEIGMGRRWAYQLLRLADGYTQDEIEVCSDCTIDGAVAALPPACPTPEPKPAPADPGTEAVTGDVMSQPEAEAAMEEAAAEADTGEPATRGENRRRRFLDLAT